MAKCHVLKREIPSALKCRSDAPRHDADPISHRRLLSLKPRKASNFAADEFFATHRFCRLGS